MFVSFRENVSKDLHVISDTQKFAFNCFFPTIKRDPRMQRGSSSFQTSSSAILGLVDFKILTDVLQLITASVSVEVFFVPFKSVI